MTLQEWQRRKRAQAEEETLGEYPPDQRWDLYDEACELRDRIERDLGKSA